ncbi:MAG: hypothetical protein HY332_25580 [Chloroflexi bacterium]|nr:hypothetical protein [Chloroflexota bacterium]
MRYAQGDVTPPPEVGAAAFLRAVQPRPREEERLEARFIAPEGRCMRRFNANAEQLVAETMRRASGWNCYFGVGLRRRENGTAAGVGRVGAVWWEVDAKLFALEKDPKAAALAAIDAFPVPASVVVDSGAGITAITVWTNRGAWSDQENASGSRR